MNDQYLIALRVLDEDNRYVLFTRRVFTKEEAVAHIDSLPPTREALIIHCNMPVTLAPAQSDEQNIQGHVWSNWGVVQEATEEVSANPTLSKWLDFAIQVEDASDDMDCGPNYIPADGHDDVSVFINVLQAMLALGITEQSALEATKFIISQRRQTNVAF